jgi:hypothetical protein
MTGMKLLLRLLAAAFFQVMATLSAMILTAPAAHALTEQQIESQCGAANGGYNTVVDNDGNRVSTCCYTVSGGSYCNTYVNGDYRGKDRVNPVQPTAYGYTKQLLVTT